MKVTQVVRWQCTNEKCLEFWQGKLTGDSAEHVKAKLAEMKRTTKARCPKCGAASPVWAFSSESFQVTW